MNIKYFNNDVSFRDGLIKGIFDMRRHECFYFILSLIVLMPAPVNAMAQLRKAIEDGDVQMVREAFEPSSTIKININEPDEQGYTLLHDAAYWQTGKNEELAQVLIDNGAAVNQESSRGQIAAHFAAGNGYYKLVFQLLGSNPGVTILNRPAVPVASAKPVALLYWATLHGQLQIVQRLISYGADVNTISENEGNTPLHLVAMSDNYQIAEVLLKASANPRVKNASGNTPLHEAAHRCSEKVVRLLLFKSKVYVDMPNNDGDTPLHLCVSSSTRFMKYESLRSIAQLLLAHGANINKKDSLWISPNDLAKMFGGPLLW